MSTDTAPRVERAHPLVLHREHVEPQSELAQIIAFGQVEQFITKLGGWPTSRAFSGRGGLRRES